MERFRTCDDCSRHVRASESTCPFCGHALAAPALMPTPRAPAQLSRAQRIALVAAVAGGLAACGDDTGPSKPSGQGAAGATAGTSSVAGAGALAGSAAAAGRGAAGQVAVPVYGAPIPPYGISPLPPQGGSGGSGGAGQGGGGGSSGEAGSAGSAGQGGSAGAAGKPAAAGSGGAMVQPLYGASPAYGLPPTPPKK